MRRSTLLFCAGVGVSILTALSAQSMPENASCFTYLPDASGGFSLTTADSSLDLLAWMEAQYGIADVQPAESLPEGVQALVRFADGTVTTIRKVQRSRTGEDSGVQALSSSISDVAGGSVHQLQGLPSIADDCEEITLSDGFPYHISGSDLPYTESFDISAATDDGDFRGTSADEISAPGGKDGFWFFTPDQTGKYLFTLLITRPGPGIPGHDLNRGNGGIGVWQGDCDSTLTEVGTNNNIFGDAFLVVSLEAGQTYTVIWEDHYIGTQNENTAQLHIEYVGVPEANENMAAINLNDLSWEGLAVEVNTLANDDLVDGDCAPEAVNPETGDHGFTPTAGAEKWYRLPATAPGSTYTVRTSPSDDELIQDTVLSLYGYNLTTHEFLPIDCNDDESEEVHFSRITFTAEAMRIYYVMVEAVGSDGVNAGRFMLEGAVEGDPTSVHDWLILN